MHNLETTVQRRRHQRYQSHFDATLSAAGESKTAFVANVSAGGVRLRTPAALVPGQIVKLQIDGTAMTGAVKYSHAAEDYFCTGLAISDSADDSNFKRRVVSRRHLRYPVKGTLRVLWRDGEGHEGVLAAKIENASESGVRLRFDRQIAVRSYVTCNDVSLGINGTGSVRYCRYSKGKYDVGVEFSGACGWRKTDGAISSDRM